jgi:hypothetical protein
MTDIQLKNEYVKRVGVDDSGGSDTSIWIEFQSGHQIEVYLSGDTVDVNHWVPNPNHQEGEFMTEWDDTSPIRLAELPYKTFGIKE